MERPGHHCSVCNKTFTEKSNLTKHRKNHFAKENWVCDVCSKSFTTKSSLNIHQKQHQYPHICLYRRGEARLQCTDAAKSVAQVPSKVEDPTWLDPKKAEAAAKISGGELWKGQLVITFGKYAGQTFRWLLENDVGWLVRLLFEYCQKGEKNELLMWQKERLLEYAREFPPVTLHLDRRLKKQQSKKETAESTISEVQQHPNYASDAELLAAADLEKACDRVPREELCYCMRKSGVTEKYVGAVQDMYEGCKTVVRCVVGVTEEFKVEVGLHQGSALSPFLFAIVMDRLTDEVCPWTMMFADDIVICSESREQVEEKLERWRFALERRGIKFSHSKTEYMCVNERDASGRVKLQGEEIKKVEDFK
ncbi:R2DM Retrovirus-related Pol polyprotein from type II retrotransposable element [Collichthys lucidus]|uniref:ribonuclease H n=1 Tax=Collichthys lucidus TaxID=240159 RepID=A0A4U5TV47_COLLU|nr:R2DM Retrovirus-related Pol polyprotein from type II retrotransposable element [Collichthys lucidus]TKS65407.1 R2DM Retrovirus-related Pol polyprotein from type II retrotransposable element [Collichthys lucidus]TKS65737.1 R2DM Retrovirus-related Pol polyprotein from type II retrotransposable element [Collichthys lucidus]